MTTPLVAACAPHKEVTPSAIPYNIGTTKPVAANAAKNAVLQVSLKI
jgi:hypothetical protein